MSVEMRRNRQVIVGALVSIVVVVGLCIAFVVGMLVANAQYYANAS